MELDEQGFLELLALRREAWDDDDAFTAGVGDFFSGDGGGQATFHCFGDGSAPTSFPNPSADPASLEAFALPPPPPQASFHCLDQVYRPFGSGFSTAAIAPENQSSSSTTTAKGCRSMAPVDEEQLGLIHEDPHCGSPSGEGQSTLCCCKLDREPAQSAAAAVTHPLAFEVAAQSNSLDSKHSRAKRAEGQPSKNLMAERRRRKRLNDRLSMLRSVVPKISKMDRTSILGDTIDYMKELLERIKGLQEEMESGTDTAQLMGILRELNPSDVLVRNAPKFDVERRDDNTRIDIFCAAKPGLLLSTVNTLEALGLEIQQCVVSCFNDFGMQASCSEDVEQRAVISGEDIKQALFRNAGYGGRCV